MDQIDSNDQIQTTLLVRVGFLTQDLIVGILGEQKKECTKILELSELQIIVNKRFTTTSNDAVYHSNRQIFFETKEISHIKSEKETTGYAFSEGFKYP